IITASRALRARRRDAETRRRGEGCNQEVCPPVLPSPRRRVSASPLLRIRYPAVEVIRALRTILVISRLDVAHVIFRNGLALVINVDLVNARRVQAEDFLFVLIGDGAVAELLLHLWRNLETAEGFNLPLRRSPPEQIRAPDHVIRAEGVEQLTDEMRRQHGLHTRRQAER